MSPDLIVVVGFDGYFKRVNPAFGACLGHTEQEALARRYIEFVHPGDRERTNARWKAMVAGVQSVSFENRYVCKDGAYRWIEWTAAPVVDERLAYVVGRDVTERRQAETDLREAEERSRVLAEQHAALIRVATLVAHGAPAAELFAAVTEEVGQLLGAHLSGLARYESDATVTVLATWADEREHGSAHPLVPGPWPLDGDDLASMIWRTGRSVRIDDYRDMKGPIAEFVRDVLGVGASLASPIVVEGRLWGTLFVHTERTRPPLPEGTESRLTEFTELAATAIGNAESRAALAASRARIVAASDETRRRIERDLHDGVQQRLVSLSLDLRLAESIEDLEEAHRTIGRVVGELTGVTADLREIARGIHPAILSEGGLGPALRTLARRSAIPTTCSVVVDRRLPEPIEVAAYYVVSEALTNATKHAHASRVDVEATARESSLHLSIRDDGVGGADPARGSGLVGLRDRVEALGGSIDVESPDDAGTAVVVALPLELDASARP